VNPVLGTETQRGYAPRRNPRHSGSPTWARTSDLLANAEPALRHSSLTGRPASACLRNPTICSSVNRLFLVSVPSSRNGLY